MSAFIPVRPGGVASAEDLDDLTAAVAALVAIESRLEARVSFEPIESVNERRAHVRANVRDLASAIARRLEAADLAVALASTSEQHRASAEERDARASVNDELAERLLERAIEAGRIVVDETRQVLQ